MDIIYIKEAHITKKKHL